jgi:D-alanyl-D-alanine-carboxypeptidase/D-alanyl-D-alanine-endopeptidase
VMAAVQGDDRVDAAGGSSGTDGLDLGPRTLFEIGSVTKTFTGLLLADMVVRGDVALTDPINDHLPDGVRAPGRNEKQIRFVDLATHTSGLPPMPPNYTRAGPPPLGLAQKLGSLVRPKTALRDYLDRAAGRYAAFGIDELQDALRETQLKRDIGVKSKYANYGFGLLGYLLTRIAGMDYADLVAQRICLPFGMTDTYSEVPSDHRHRFAQGHAPGGLPVREWQIGPGLGAAGVIRSTADDMVRYATANLRPESSPLEGAVRLAQQMHHARAKAKRGGVGLGWQINPPIIWHNGGTGGFGTYLGFRHDTDAAIVILSNSFHGMLRSVDHAGRTFLNGKRSGDAM